MNLYFTLLTFINVFVLFTLSIVILNNKKMTRDQKGNFVFIIFLTIALVFVEFGAVYIYRITNPSYRWLNYTLHYLEFTFVPIIPVLIANTIVEEKKYKISFIISTVYGVVFLISLFFKKSIFFIDENNVYSRDVMFPVYIVASVSGLIYLILENLSLALRFQIKNKILLLLTSILFMLGFLIGVFVPEVHLKFLVTTIALLVYYIYKNDLFDQVDPLTLMLNQKMYQNDITTLTHPYLLVIFGIDNIKNVNEIYGIETGDDCISVVAERIRTFYKKYGVCYRITGTEFCCIIKHVSINIEDINDEFFHSIVKKTYDMRELPFVTVGYAVHNRNENFDEVMKRANLNRLEFRETRNQRIFF